MRRSIQFVLIASLFSLWAGNATAQSADDSSVAQQLQNPIANLISVPFQSNFDFGIGPGDDGFLYSLNIQPVIPISLGEDWNLVTRTIIPVSYRDVPALGTDSGLGDIVQSFFFSPKKVGSAGIIWGVGPVFLYPTATNRRLGTEKFGAGITAVVLRQDGGWTYGGLVNHIWSVAGRRSRADISATFFQPFVSYTFKSATTVFANLELTHDWESNSTVAPVVLGVSQTLKLGGQLFSLAAAGKYYVQRPAGGPDWGIRVNLTLIFPK